MDNIIQQLINIEARAQDVVRGSKEFEADFENMVGKSIDNMKSSISQKAEQRMADVDSFESGDADKRIDSIKRAMSAEKEKLVQKEKENHTAWVDRIFNEIISI